MSDEKPKNIGKAKYTKKQMSYGELHLKAGLEMDYPAFASQCLDLMLKQDHDDILINIHVDGEFLFELKTLRFVKMFCQKWSENGNKFIVDEKSIGEVKSWNEMLKEIEGESVLPPKSVN